MFSVRPFIMTGSVLIAAGQLAFATQELVPVTGTLLGLDQNKIELTQEESQEMEAKRLEFLKEHINTPSEAGKTITWKNGRFQGEFSMDKDSNGLFQLQLDPAVPCIRYVHLLAEAATRKQVYYGRSTACFMNNAWFRFLAKDVVARGEAVKPPPPTPDVPNTPMGPDFSVRYPTILTRLEVGNYVSLIKKLQLDIDALVAQQKANPKYAANNEEFWAEYRKTVELTWGRLRAHYFRVEMGERNQSLSFEQLAILAKQFKSEQARYAAVRRFLGCNDFSEKEMQGFKQKRPDVEKSFVSSIYAGVDEQSHLASAFNDGSIRADINTILNSNYASNKKHDARCPMTEEPQQGVPRRRR